MGRIIDEHSLSIIHQVVNQAPQWIRNDLSSKDESLRRRAEETLAAMIANAIERGTDEAPRGFA